MRKSKTIVAAIGTILLMLLIGGCSSNELVDKSVLESVEADASSVQAELNSVKADKEKAVTEIESLNAELELAQSEAESAKTELDTVSKEYNRYKESMAEYEGLATAEAEVRRIEAESIAESEAARKKAEEEKERARKESEAAAEAARLEAELKKGYETGITYDQLIRTPDEYMFELVKFKGEVVQAVEGNGSSNMIRLAVNGSYKQILYCEYDKSIVSRRILEGDNITIYGMSCGLTTYESTGSGYITIPSVLVDKIDQ